MIKSIIRFYQSGLKFISQIIRRIPRNAVSHLSVLFPKTSIMQKLDRSLCRQWQRCRWWHLKTNAYVSLLLVVVKTNSTCATTPVTLSMPRVIIGAGCGGGMMGDGDFCLQIQHYWFLGTIWLGPPLFVHLQPLPTKTFNIWFMLKMKICLKDLSIPADILLLFFFFLHFGSFQATSDLRA